MEQYNYLEAVKADVKEWINENINLDDYRNDPYELDAILNETLWVCDYVTGNGSGSYTFNAWTAAENIAHNWDLLIEALAEFGDERSGRELLENGPEWCDVVIRCYVLSEAISEVLHDLGFYK